MRPFSKIFFTFSTIVFTISITRFFDSITKQELNDELKSIERENREISLELKNLSDSLLALKRERDLRALRKDLISFKEEYLLIERIQKQAHLKIEDKTLRTMSFQIKGRKVIEGEIALPKGILEIKEKRKGTSFYKPDWIYELEGITPPQDIISRTIIDAFGSYILTVGGDIAICGLLKEEVPIEATDLIYLEFKDIDLEAIYNTLKLGSKVIFQ